MRGRWPAAPGCGWRSSTPVSTRARRTSTAACCATRTTLANGVDDDHNGLIDDTRGWDFVADQQNVGDDGGHGTHVAGIIGARSDNGVTVTGLASRVQVVAVRALGAEFGSTSDVAAGFTYAIEEYGARVVNLSLSGSSWSQLMAEGFCQYPNVLFVAAAGNDSRERRQPSRPTPAPTTCRT